MSWPTRQPELRPAAMGPVGRFRRHWPTSSHAGGVVTLPAPRPSPSRRSDPRLRDLQGGRGPPLAAGLDLLAPATGLRAAVVPHYDNAEGGTHDTRFCYMGERAAAPARARITGGYLHPRRRQPHRPSRSISSGSPHRSLAWAGSPSGSADAAASSRVAVRSPLKRSTRLRAS